MMFVMISLLPQASAPYCVRGSSSLPEPLPTSVWDSPGHVTGPLPLLAWDRPAFSGVYCSFLSFPVVDVSWGISAHSQSFGAG